MSISELSCVIFMVEPVWVFFSEKHVACLSAAIRYEEGSVNKGIYLLAPDVESRSFPVKNIVRC